MKKILPTLIIILSFTFCYSQDIIELNNGDEIKAKVTEISTKEVKYKKFNNLDGPTYTINLAKIIKIIYENGEIETFISKNLRRIRPFGVNLGAGHFISDELGIVFLSAEYFIIPQFSLEANIGITDFEAPFFYYFVGGKGYLNSDISQNNFAPFIGALFGSEYDEFMINIPLGLDYISKKGFNASISLNQIFYFSSYERGTFIALKIGWRFKK